MLTPQKMKSPLANNHILRFVFLFLAISTILDALMAVAQERTAQQSTRSSIAAVPKVDSAERVSVSRLQTKRQYARMTTIDSSFSFLPPLLYDSGGGAVSTAIADVNGDGKADLLVANYNSGTVSVLLGNGDGTFQPAVTYNCGGPDNPYSIAVGDFNGDGKPDIALLVVVNVSPRPALRILLGNGDGTFQAPVAYDTGGFNPYQVVVADVNRDSKLDLVIANEFVASVLLGNGDGTFQAAVTYGIEGSANSLAVGDVNADGNPDLIVAPDGSTDRREGPGEPSS